MSVAAERLHLFGIRHHGPGSARSLLAALDTVDPATVLIESPVDAEAVVGYAASPAMKLPLAILVHGQDNPSNAAFYPYAIYSPEWQAMRWALQRGRSVKFIDLPVQHRLAIDAERRQAAEDVAEDAAPAEADAPRDCKDAEPGEGEITAMRIRRDPLGALAAVAGYDDGEAWWNALIEQGMNAPSVFAAIETAMATLRADVECAPWRDAARQKIEDCREAHMRLAIADALSESEGQVAVVCGAWHVPALRRPSQKTDDRALLKGLPKIKVTATWVPWTDTRLASMSGYGAGVTSPAWYAHVWQSFDRHKGEQRDAARAFAASWLTRVARLLRSKGLPASTASVIEAVRLAETLAALREQSMPGLEEMREASLATLCGGEPAPMRLIESELVVGRGVGEVDDAVPQMPLAADLARWQKKLRLKLDALDEVVSVDVRSEAGLAKSLLLHRLNLINVPWGRMTGSGASRGTFRENWQLRWEPEFSVKIAEALVYGTTVVEAASNAAVARARTAQSLPDIAEAVRGTLLAGLDGAARTAIGLLQARAASTSDTANLAATMTPLATILRYGTARAMPTEELRLLVSSLAEAVSAGLVYACRSLQPPEAADLREKLNDFDRAVTLMEHEARTDQWTRALAGVASDEASHALLKGFAVRALYDRGRLGVNETGKHLSRALSRAVPSERAGQWLDGFLGQSGQLLVHDASLRATIDVWLTTLSEEDFTLLLPMLRRALSSLDRSERRRLIEDLRRVPATVAQSGEQAWPDAAALPAGGLRPAPGFAAGLPLLATILGLNEGVRSL